MKIQFSRDPETQLSHCQAGVTEEEIADVLSQPREDRYGQDGSRVALGRTRSGRYLRVIYVPYLQPDTVFVITAHELSPKPLLAYNGREWRRRK